MCTLFRVLVYSLILVFLKKTLKNAGKVNISDKQNGRHTGLWNLSPQFNKLCSAVQFLLVGTTKQYKLRNAMKRCIVTNKRLQNVEIDGFVWGLRDRIEILKANGMYDFVRLLK